MLVSLLVALAATVTWAPVVAGAAQSLTGWEPGSIPPSPTGQGDVLVIPTHYGTPGSFDLVKATFDDLFANTVSSSLVHMSQGRFSLEPPDYADWAGITQPTEVCDTRSIQSQANAAARSQGLFPSNYDFVVIYAASTPACSDHPFVAQTRGRTSILFGHGSSELGWRLVNAIGANLGLGSSDILDCGAAPLTPDWPDGCTVRAGADRSSAMGSPYWTTFGANQLTALGWLDESDSGGYRRVTEHGTEVQIAPLSCDDLCTATPRAVLLQAGEHQLWFELRAPYAQDALVPEGYRHGVLIRQHVLQPGFPAPVGSRLIEATGGNVSPVLPEGGTFWAPGTNWQVEVLDICEPPDGLCSTTPTGSWATLRFEKVLSLRSLTPAGSDGWIRSSSVDVQASSIVAALGKPTCSAVRPDGDVEVLSHLVTGPTPGGPWNVPVPIELDGTYRVDCATTQAGHEFRDSLTLKLDRTGPVLTPQVSPAPVDGWNRSDTTVSWTCTDGTSGVASSAQPTPTVVTTEGETVVSASCQDKAGNTTTASVTVKIDKTAPMLTASPSTPPSATGWWRAPVTYSFTCTDDRSGVASQPTPRTFGHGKDQTFTGSCTDKAGNSASLPIGPVHVDTVDPVLTYTRTAPNAAGWNNGEVTVLWTCTDDLSGMGGQTSSNIVSDEGVTEGLEGFCEDLAGNRVTKVVDPIRIDMTPPTIRRTTRTAANEHGWNKGNVVVAWACEDALSGPTDPSFSTLLTAEGEGQSASGTCTDLAGNASAPNTVSDINIDKTAPGIELVERTPANEHGWNAGAVQLRWACTDALSGPVEDTLEATVDDDGADQEREATCLDRAGNSSSHRASGINVDTKVPTITRSSRTSANEHGWNNGDVEVIWTCEDDTSGPLAGTVASTVGTEGEGQATTGTCTDLAGNASSHTESGINVDKTAPLITLVERTLENEHGWNNGDVSITWACADELSTAVEDTIERTVTTEGADQSATGTCTDLAGNAASATETSIDIDKTAPTATIDLPAKLARFLLGQPVTPVYGCADDLSLVDTCTGPAMDTGSVGRKTFEVTAVDRAGNTFRTANEYQVYRTTALSAGPVLVQTVLGIPTTGVLSARLVGVEDGLPLAGKELRFSVRGKELCTVVTRADGLATCPALRSLLTLILSGGYDVEFAGDAENDPSTATGTLLSRKLIP